MPRPSAQRLGISPKLSFLRTTCTCTISPKKQRPRAKRWATGSRCCKSLRFVDGYVEGVLFLWMDSAEFDRRTRKSEHHAGRGRKQNGSAGFPSRVRYLEHILQNSFYPWLSGNKKRKALIWLLPPPLLLHVCTVLHCHRTWRQLGNGGGAAEGLRRRGVWKIQYQLNSSSNLQLNPLALDLFRYRHRLPLESQSPSRISIVTSIFGAFSLFLHFHLVKSSLN